MQGKMTAMALGVGLAAGLAWGDVDVGKLTGIFTGPDCTPREKLAAEALAGKLNAMYATKLTVNPTNPMYAPTLENAIFVGKKAALDSGLITAGELQKVKYDGFVIRAHDGRLALAGFRDRGTIYAVYGLLQRLGYRWFAPGCETIPKPKDAVLKDMDIADKPAFEFRGGGEWKQRWSVDDCGLPGHSSGVLVPIATYYDQHPEYFAMRWDGTRIPRTTCEQYTHLCLSNPDVIRISTEEALKIVRKKPDQRFFTIAHGDGVDWCQCASCRAMDVVPGAYSDRLLKWVNHIARAVKQEFPDKIILTYGYCGTDAPPVKETPEDNVIVLYAPYWGVALSEIHPLTHPSNAESLKQLEGWTKMAPKNMGVYEYNFYYVLSWKAMAEKIKWYAGKGMRAMHFCGYPSCFRDLFIHVMSNLLWDPSLDNEKLKEEFVQAYYGPAAPHVLAYLKLVEDRIDEGYTKGVHEFRMPPGFYAFGFTQAAMALFDKMLAAAKDDPALLKKIQTERDLFVYDYAKSVTLAKKDLGGEEREFSLRLYKACLAAELEEDKAFDRQLAQKGLTEEQCDQATKRQAALRSQLREKLGEYAHLTLPKETEIIPLVAAFIKDHEQVIRDYPYKPEYPSTEAEKMPGGIRLAATVFRDGYGPSRNAWFCEPRVAMFIYSPKSPRPATMQAEFNLEAEPPGEATLKFEGQDADKDLPPKTSIAVSLNGKPLFEGPCEAVKRGWSWQTVKIPRGVLKQGKNVLEYKNIMTSGRLDHYWFSLAEAQIVFSPIGDMK